MVSDSCDPLVRLNKVGGGSIVDRVVQMKDAY
jgi:hypothetical protein